MKNELNINSKKHVLVQFNKKLSKNDIQLLKEDGIELKNKISDKTWYVLVNKNFEDIFIETSEGLKLKNKNYYEKYLVSSILEIDNSYKHSDGVKNKNFQSYDNDESGKVYLTLTTHKNIDEKVISNKLKTLNVDILSINKLRNSLVLNIKTNENNIKNFLSLDEVVWLEHSLRSIENQMDLTKNFMGIPYLNNYSSYNLTGNGVTIMQSEGKEPYKHNDFAGRLVHRECDDWLNCFSSELDGEHATWIAGIMIGNGSLNENMSGIAPKAELISYSVDTTYNSTGDMYDDYQNAIFSRNADLSQNAWRIDMTNDNTCTYYGDYTSVQKLLDENIIIPNNSTGKTIPIIFANGNDGDRNLNATCTHFSGKAYGRINPQASSKNVISV
ncbi:MAG: S8 family serine peptidase [Nanoarchaeota archaeon]|nr:S8 family serine peptidase [Nanoarchaeota archaeon]